MTHGWGLDSTIWDYASRDLGRSHPIVVWDLPGLGRSRVKSDGVSLPAFATALRHVVEASTSDRVVLVGHSIGGMTIQTLVRDQPDFVRDRVAGIVLINTTYTNPLKTMILSRPLLALQKPILEPLFRLMAWLQPLAWIGAWQSYLSGSAHIANRFGFGRYVTRSQLEQTTLLATRNPPGVQARGNLAMFHWDATDALKALNVPLLVLGGDMDIITKASASRDIVDQAGGDLQIVEGVNHMGFLERSDLYHLAIETFVADLPTRHPFEL
jgi:pimeloyl-ACP methyl ester carboxylesterase